LITTLTCLRAANCGAEQELTATSSDQYITSPGYSTHYRIYTNCTWKISVRTAYGSISFRLCYDNYCDLSLSIWDDDDHY